MRNPVIPANLISRLSNSVDNLTILYMKIRFNFAEIGSKFFATCLRGRNAPQRDSN